MPESPVHDPETKGVKFALNSADSRVEIARCNGCYPLACQRLHQRGMLTWHLDSGSKYKLGIFFVAKKSGQMRIVFDTRMVNCRFA